MKLTPRQQATRDLIIFYSNLNSFTEKLDIYLNYSIVNHKDGYVWRSSENNSHDRCTAIWMDIQKINQDESFDKIILTSDDGNEFRIAKTKEEVEAYIKKKYINPGRNKFIRAASMIKKIKNNGQGQFSNSNIIDFIETFGKE